MEGEQKTVEVAEEATAPETKVAAVPTRSELKDKGWSKPELDSAEKRGMVQKPEEKKDPKVEADAMAAAAKAKAEAETEAKAKGAADPEKKGESSLPDFEIKDPAKLQVFLDTFGPGTPQRAMYFRMKNERQSRQRAEQERDRLALELQMRKDADVRAKTGGPEPEVDAEGNVIDPDDQPLTPKMLKAMQKAEQEKINKDQAELNERSGKVAEAMKTQEEYAKATIPDFEDTVRLAKDVVTNIDAIENPIKKSKAIKLLRDLQVAAATADKYGVDDYTASMIAYELGQMHPDYGQKKAEPDGAKKDPKANGSLTPEQMKRIEENTQRRASSASLPGSPGGRRTVSVEDVTIKDVLRMDPEERRAFKKNHPARFDKLMRG